MGGGVMSKPLLFPMIRRQVLELLNNYVRAPEILQHVDTYIVPPALGHRAGALGGLALAADAVPVPVICTGGFQTASVIRDAITSGSCDAVSAARPLVANNDLVQHFKAGLDRAPKPCTYCNKCLAHVVEHPLGCYEEKRFDSREEMLAQIMSVFSPAPFA